MMYMFIKNMFIMRRVDVDTVQSFVEKYITQVQADEIITMAQIEV